VFHLAAGAAVKQQPAASAGSSGSAELEAERKRLQAERDAFAREKREADERAKLEAERRQLEEERRRLAEQRVAEAESKKIEEARVRPPSVPGQTGREITGKDGAPMLLVPAGEFLYGDNNQRMSLSAFYMDKYEVTTKLYAAFMQATGRAAPKSWNKVSLISDGDRPVIDMTWHDADAYCRQYGKRLPTEQEWEKAARGTDGRKYPWGNEEPNRSLANYNWDGKRDWQGYATLASVESYEAGKSPYGIYNMAGNVWEWTSSDSGSGRKVFRGGSWSDIAFGMRSTFRFGYPPADLGDENGFRCAQDVSR
jgi:formylglycine-generating enzyme required for sulfatase activity